MRTIIQYDANGKRTNAVVAAAVSAAQYEPQDRLLSYDSATYQYNEAGTLTNKTVGGQSTSYRYDALGSLLSVSSLADPSGRLGQAATSAVGYSVDALGRRIAKRVNGVMTRGYVYKDFLNPVAEVDNDDNVVSVFIYGTRRHVPDYLVKNGVTYRIISDHLGSVRLVVSNVDGSIAQRIDYDEWGRVVLDTNPGFQPFGFAGGLYDPDTGLVRFGFRDYDPEGGRWLAKDPILFAGKQVNLYEYVRNNPINMHDPSGLFGSVNNCVSIYNQEVSAQYRYYGGQEVELDQNSTEDIVVVTVVSILVEGAVLGGVAVLGSAAGSALLSGGIAEAEVAAMGSIAKIAAVGTVINQAVVVPALRLSYQFITRYSSEIIAIVSIVDDLITVVDMVSEKTEDTECQPQEKQ